MALTGWILGTVTDKDTGAPIQGAIIKTSNGGQGVSFPSGAYIIIEQAGTWDVTATFEPKNPQTNTGVVVPEGGSIDHVDFILEGGDETQGDCEGGEF